jgi:hypothetical protein
MTRNISPADVRAKRLLRLDTKNLSADDRAFLLCRLAKVLAHRVADPLAA